jgi:hypothetical protein
MVGHVECCEAALDMVGEMLYHLLSRRGAPGWTGELPEAGEYTGQVYAV